MELQVLVFMSEIKFDYTLQKKKKKKKKKIKFSVSFMPLFTISFYLLFDSHVRKLTFFRAITRQFGLVQYI